MIRLAEYRREPARLADLVLWAGLIAPGVVCNKDGAFQQTLRFRGPDLESVTPGELVAVAQRLNNVFTRLTSGWAVFLEAQRRPAVAYPVSTWPNLVSGLLDEDRRALFEEEGVHFETDYFLMLVYRTPAAHTARLRRLLYEHLPAGDTVDYREVLTWFQHQVGRLRDLLADVFPVIEPLDDAETLTYLHSTVSTKRHPVAVPEVPMYLDVFLTDEDLQGGIRPRLGEAWLRTLTIRAFPSATFPGMLEALDHLGLTYRYVLRFLALDRVDAIREIRKYERRWLA